MIRVIRCLTMIVLSLIAYMSNELGFRWIEEGYGLHPALAFGIATSCVWSVIILLLNELRMHQIDIDQDLNKQMLSKLP